ncbi:MAG: YhcN/YlaJ family sporulation lipoprotein [Clostridia bacterium]
MKKISLILIIITLTALLLLSTCVYADTTSTKTMDDDIFLGKTIMKEIKKIDNIVDCRVLVSDGYCVIAVHCKGLVTKTAYNELLEKVEKTVKENHPTLIHIKATSSLKAFRMIEKLAREMEKGISPLDYFELNDFAIPQPRDKQKENKDCPNKKNCPTPYNNDKTSENNQTQQSEKKYNL